MDFIGKNRNKPFALVVGYKAAHGPFQPPPRLSDKYAGKESRPTPNTDVPPIYAGKFSPGRRKTMLSPKRKRPTPMANPRPKPAMLPVTRAILAASPPSMKTWAG